VVPSSQYARVHLASSDSTAHATVDVEEYTLSMDFRRKTTDSCVAASAALHWTRPNSILPKLLNGIATSGTYTARMRVANVQYRDTDTWIAAGGA
jgi:hypothetical protein